MKWLSVKEIAKISGVSERTLRFYIADGRIKARKEGRAWQCEVKSLQKVGINIAEQEVAETANTAALPNTAVKSAATGNRIAAKKSTRKRRSYQTLEDLGVYKDLLAMWFEYPIKDSEESFRLIKYVLEQTALGFYEYHPPRKVTFFRAAREGVVRAIVAFKMLRSPKSHDALWVSGLENDILPGIIGLIRRAEKRESGK